jgi:hypothetical protein
MALASFGVRPAGVRAEGPPGDQATAAAVTALNAMGAFLRTQPQFLVHAETSTDAVLPTGQKVKEEGVATLTVQRPDRLRADVVSERDTKQIFYDGRTFTLYEPQPGYYASFAAPPMLRGLLDVLEKKYGLDLPLADLFRWGTDESNVGAIRSATTVGKSAVDGATCTHYAFHQDDVDWEVWIQDGPQPLPRKMVVTTTSERTQPQHVTVMRWDLAPRIEAPTFTFVPPKDAHAIRFQTVDVPTRPSPGNPTRQTHPEATP